MYFFNANGVKELVSGSGIELDQTKLIDSTFESLSTDLSLKSSGASGTITIRKSDNSSALIYEEAFDRIQTSTDLDIQETLFTDAISPSTIDSDITVNGISVSSTGLVLLGSTAITNVLHATTKQYVDNLVDGLKWKEEALAGSTGNIDLSTGGLTPSGLDTGVTLIAGSRVLVFNQTDATENGIYNAAVGSWSRSSDANTGTELISAVLFISTGTTYADTCYVCTNDAITEWTTSITFVLRTSGMNHNDLSSIQGGTTSEYYHLNSSEHVELTAWIDDVTLSNGGSMDLGSGSLTTSTKVVSPEIESSSGTLTLDIQDIAADSNINLVNSVGAFNANLNLDGQIKVDTIVENTTDNGVQIENLTIENDGTNTTMETSGAALVIRRGATIIARFS